MKFNRFLSLTAVALLIGYLPLKEVKGELVLSNETLSNQQLEDGCTGGTQWNAMLGQSGGYMENIFKGMLVNGGINGSDYAKIQRWFYANCPSGW